MGLETYAMRCDGEEIEEAEGMTERRCWIMRGRRKRRGKGIGRRKKRGGARGGVREGQY